MNWFTKFKDELSEGNITPRSKASQEWFLEKIRGMSDVSMNRNTMMRNEPLKQATKTIAGKMYMFWYNPKGKDELPYYDKFPLVLPLGVEGQTLLALNMHYLPVDLRQALFYGLLNTVNNRKYDDSTYMKVTYEFLKSTAALKAYRPCVKKYLAGNIMGKIVNVPAQEWEIAVHMPTAVWMKKDESYVHNRSREQIRNF